MMWNLGLENKSCYTHTKNTISILSWIKNNPTVFSYKLQKEIPELAHYRSSIAGSFRRYEKRDDIWLYVRRGWYHDKSDITLEKTNAISYYERIGLNEYLLKK